MGAEARSSSTNVNYYKMKNGNFYLSTDTELTNPLGSITGTLSRVVRKDETARGFGFKIQFSLKDSNGEISVITLNDESSSLVDFLGFLLSADLNKEIELNAIKATEKDSSGNYVPRLTVKGDFITGILIKQGDETMKNFFGRGKGNELPAWIKKEKRGKIEWDRDDYWDKVAEYVSDLISKYNGGYQTPVQKEAPKETPAFEDDGLPF